MTQLTDDLATIAARHSNTPPDIAVMVPIGAIRAALIALRRFDGFPLVDRNTEVAVVPEVGRQWQRKKLGCPKS